MLVSGFTVLRNAQLMDYPAVESIRSALPLVDEYVVAIGQCDDQTRADIEAIGDPKIKIIDTHWDCSRSTGGLILSEKTNEALSFCKGTWCLYLQADEVLHECDYERLRACMAQHRDNEAVQGILFKYIHFYGSFDTIATSRKWYRSEIRIVRNNETIQSVGDAKGFRSNGKKLDVVDSGATVYHYGWVKPPKQMGQKCKHFLRWWYGNARDGDFDSFEFSRIYGLKKFAGSHPSAIAERVKNQGWVFDRRRRWADVQISDARLVLSDCLEKIVGTLPFEKKPYRRVISSVS
jgi:glycosyltransferase involved in cell wall biosynthesis